MPQTVDDSTAFYDTLAPLFDVMTDWDARLTTEEPFLRNVLERAGVRSVLDAACGSGGHALALARWGYLVSGADASAVMIEIARAKAGEAGLNIPFVVAPLSDLPEVMPGPFDAVLCVGNSLPHLPTQDALVAALNAMAAVLRPGGTLVLHNLNYDLRWQVRPRWFAAQGGVLDGQEVLVWRFADYHEETQQIGFNIALFHKHESGWKVEVHTTPHRPLFRAELLAALGAAGFASAETYAAMTWPLSPFEAGASGDLVIVATRQTGPAVTEEQLRSASSA
jgi:glycine/sarcosine N-methyltransferase